MARNARIRRTFTPQFKKDAVALLKQGRSATDVAHSLGIARSLLQRWKDQLDRKQAPEVFPGSGNRSPEGQDVAELRKKLRRVTEERDILKKALAFFAEDES
jgi:transposase